MKSKIMRLCSAMLVLTLAIAISMSSFAFAGGEAVERNLSVEITPDGTINWTDPVVLGGYYFDSDTFGLKNNGNAICDIEVKGAPAIMDVGANWVIQPVVNATAQVNEYNLYWNNVGLSGKTELRSHVYKLIVNDLAIGYTVTSRLALRTPATGSTTGNFTITPDFRAIPHSDLNP